jgi:Raf kinase inhibitor-like YbhB/YbcL family protein
MTTPLDGDIEQRGSLELTAPAFEAGGRMPDSTGYANENANPTLEIGGVPDGTESLVVVLDDPDAQPVGGHTWDHWLVWDIDPGVGTIPERWNATGAVEGYNDYVEQGYGGPSPPEGTHAYRFKLLALDATLGMPEQTRKARLGSAIAMGAEILGATQLVGTYDASQGTAF